MITRPAYQRVYTKKEPKIVELETVPKWALETIANFGKASSSQDAGPKWIPPPPPAPPRRIARTTSDADVPPKRQQVKVEEAEEACAKTTSDPSSGEEDDEAWANATSDPYMFDGSGYYLAD